jgi:hypothetical protein
MAKYRISFLAGLATGYVLGARAGRERYEQIMKAARTVTEHPAVQQAAGAVQAQATGLASAAGARISDEVRDKAPQFARSAKSATARVTERVPGLRGRDSAPDDSAAEGGAAEGSAAEGGAAADDEAGRHGNGHRTAGGGPAGGGSPRAAGRRDGTIPGS